MCTIIKQIDTSLPHVHKKNKNMHCSSNYPPKLLLYYYSRKQILERKYSETLRAQNGNDGTIERERERGKSSSITIAQNMVKKRVRGGFLLYLERQTHPSWINAKCPTPRKREGRTIQGLHKRSIVQMSEKKCWDQAKCV